MANWPEDCADCEKDWFEDQVEQVAKTPEEIRDFLFHNLRYPNEFLAPMSFESPGTFAILPMPHNRRKSMRDLFFCSGFFPLFQQGVYLGHVAIRCAARGAVEAKASERRIKSIHRGMLEEFPPQMEVGGEFATIRDA